MIAKDQNNDYQKGFIVGMLTVAFSFLPYMIALTLIMKLPEFYSTVGAIVFCFVFILTFLRVIIKVERFIRLKIEKLGMFKQEMQTQ
jgi:hypothetical protein